MHLTHFLTWHTLCLPIPPHKFQAPFIYKPKPKLGKAWLPTNPQQTTAISHPLPHATQLLSTRLSPRNSRIIQLRHKQTLLRTPRDPFTGRSTQGSGVNTLLSHQWTNLTISEWSISPRDFCVQKVYITLGKEMNEWCQTEDIISLKRRVVKLQSLRKDMKNYGRLCGIKTLKG